MKIKLIAIIFLIFLFPTSSQCQKIVDFESLVFGTQYGLPAGNIFGDIIFTENDIIVSIHEFELMGGGIAFNFCQVDTAFSGFGSGQTMAVNNISLQFDFTNLLFTANRVTFEFADLGGFENISVNGQPTFIGELTAAPANIAPGVALGMVTMPIEGGIKGDVTLTGQVNTLRIGGQELWLDNIIAQDTTITGTDVPDKYPKTFVLKQNYPNPFNPETTISFELPVGWTAPVILRIFNIQGQVVKVMLANEILLAGTHKFVWNGKGDNDVPMASGVYLYQIISGEFVAAKKMVLAR